MDERKNTVGVFIAIIQSTAIRDVQVCTNAEHDHTDEDSWADYQGAEIYIGVYQDTYKNALERAANDAGTVKENIRLIQLATV